MFINTEKSDIKIIGDNILFVNKNLFAHYILPLKNYSVASESGIELNIDILKSIFPTLVSNKPDLEFTIQRCTKVIKRRDILNNLIDTIKIYTPDYNMPEEFTKNIRDNETEYCLLIIKLEQTDIVDIEGDTIWETAKNVVGQLANKVMSLGTLNLNIEKVMEIEDNIYSMIKTRCQRASAELVFYNYASKLYPAYAISYDKLSYFKDTNYSDVLGSLTQTIEDKFGYFIMHNEGVDIFGLDPQDIYGCILNLYEMPQIIDKAYFPINVPNTQVSVKMLPKAKASIAIKRKRGSIEAEWDEANQAEAHNERLNALRTTYDISNKAIEAIDNGELTCKFNVSILVLGDSLKDLRDRTNAVISSLKDRQILPSKSLKQCQDFVTTWVNLCPTRYPFMAPLEFPLSFQLNYGAIVGEFDAVVEVPSIGYTK